MKSPPEDRLENDEAFLLRTDLAKMGFAPRAVDAIFGALPVVLLPSYSRPLIRVRDFKEYIQEHTYQTDRVWPIRRPRRR